MAVPLAASEIARELADYEIVLGPTGLAQLETYLDLLVRWNRRMNLTGIRAPRRMVRELFGESLYISRVVDLQGWLVDVGSGAGFPGLALKLAAPALRVTLIESRRKKCAFLKEAVRACGFTTSEVVNERFESWAKRYPGQVEADIITTRAVEVGGKLLGEMRRIVRKSGTVVIATTGSLSEGIRSGAGEWDWARAQMIPGGQGRVVLVGIAAKSR